MEVGVVCRSCWIPEPLFAQAAAPGYPDCNVSVFSLQMSGADTAGDDDDASRKRKSKNLYVGKIPGPHPSDRGGRVGGAPCTPLRPLPSGLFPMPSGLGVEVERRG